MEDISYGENGCRIASLNDYQIFRLNRSRDSEICLITLLGMSGSLGCFVWLSFDSNLVGGAAGFEFLPVSVFLISLLAGLTGFRIEAEENGKLRSRTNGAADHQHVTGLGAAVVLLILVFVLTAARLGEVNYPDFVIPEWAGQFAMLAMCAGFLMLTLATRIYDPGPFYGLLRGLRLVTARLNPLGRVLSRFDASLVYVVAPLAGATLDRTSRRYGVLVAQLASACAFAWYAPAPFGLLGAVWALLISVSVARRWAWIESDRALKHQNPDIAQSQLRVGTRQDLRDEALFSLLFLLLVLPLGMRQFHLALPDLQVFAFSGGAEDNFFAWTGFFGVELVKALPFLDWADVYDAHGTTRVQLNGPGAMHLLFGARIILDLVFLSALLQAISISVSLAKHKRKFFEPGSGVCILDERIEQAEFSRLAFRSVDSWQFRPELDLFLHYDVRQLARLRRLARTHHRYRIEVVIDEIVRRADLTMRPPGEQLAEVANEKQPRSGELQAAIQLVIDEDDFDLDYLAAARLALNWKRGLETQRIQIVQLICQKLAPSSDREAVLVEILAGEHSDSLGGVRLIAVDSLARNVGNFPAGIPTLQQAALGDKSNSVKRRAAAALKAIRVQPGQSVAQGRSFARATG